MADEKQQSTGLEKGVIERASDEAKDRFVRGFTKAVDLSARTIDGVASTINLDRDGDVILPSAFKKHLARFAKSNAPFLAAHTHRTTDGTPPQIGWVVEISVTAAEVPCKFKFAVTDLAEQWWKLASDPEGKGIAFSIGFIPVRWVCGSVADLAKEFPELKPIFAAAGLKDEDRLYVFTEIELLEISAVPVPANRESLQRIAAKFFADRDDPDQAAKVFIDAIADAVIARLPQPVPSELLTTSASSAPSVAKQFEDLKAFILEQNDETRSMLPDDVNPFAADDPPPAGSDEGAGAAAGKEGASESSRTARRLRPRLEQADPKTHTPE